ncbi:MAG: porin, partial [Verrucomicrobiales bacterium]
IDKENVENQWIAWQPHDEFGIKIGQQKPLWSQEWSTSSNSMITMERSLLVNQLRPKHSLGAYVSGELNQWAYGVGWFDGDLGSRDSSDTNFLLLSLGRSTDDWFPWLDDGRWRLDYLHNDVGNRSSPAKYDYSLASSLSGKVGRWRWVGEVLYADGTREDGDVYGVTVVPSIDIIKDKLQFVLRYQLAGSEGDNLRLQDRYEIAGGATGDASGDHYQAYYGGLNYYLRGNRAKLMGGIEYADMRDPNNNGGDYSGWTVIGGVRISF